MRAVSEPGGAGARDGRSAPRDDAARLRALLDIAQVIGASRTEDLVERLAESARRALDGASLSISRWDREHGVLRTLVNVGSVGQPRDGDNRASYVIVDGDVVIFRRVKYDYEATMAKIRRVPSLDDFLARRLKLGK